MAKHGDNPKRKKREEEVSDGLEEKVLFINRCSKVDVSSASLH